MRAMLQVRPTRPFGPALACRCVLLTAVAAVGCNASAHHVDPEANLSGARFCLDPASVVVTTQGDVAVGDQGVRLAVHEAVGSTLTALRVAWEPATACPPESDRIHLGLEVRYLDPEKYINFPPDAVSYVLVLAIEPAEGSERSFASVASDLFSGAGGAAAVEEELVARARSSAAELAAAWWEGNPVRRGSALPTVRLVVLIASGLALVLAAGYRFWRDRAVARSSQVAA